MRPFQKILLFVSLALGLVSSAAAQPSYYETSFSDAGLITFQNEKVPLVTSSLPAWGANWGWLGATITRTPFKNGTATLSGSIDALGITIGGSIDARDLTAIKETFTFHVAAATAPITGIALQHNLVLRDDLGTATSVALKSTSPFKVTWPYTQNSGVSIEFSGNFKEIYNEGGNQAVPRAWFWSNQSIPAGDYSFTVVYRLPAGAVMIPDGRYAAASSSWYKNALAFDDSPVDLSFLNSERAGSHGFVTRAGDQLQFSDGTPVRFWGTNLTAYALGNNSLSAKKLTAKRLAKLGYNLVRLHHHDSGWVSPNIFDPNGNSILKLNPTMLKEIDEWISVLKDAGIYVWLDLHVGATLRPGDRSTAECGTITTWDEIAKINYAIGGFVQYDPQIQCLFNRLLHLYFDRTSSVTGLAYKDEPAIMGILITNEDRIIDHQGHYPLADKGNPVLRQMFLNKTHPFAQRTGLNVNNVEQTWVPGPSKYFLTEQEWNFLAGPIGELRKIGFRIPIITGHQWGGNGQFALPELLQSDVTDVHSYGPAESLSTHPAYTANFVTYIAAQQTVGRPLSITEYNTEYPTIDRFTTPLYVASIAALQGWDAPMIYAYSQGGGLDQQPQGVDVWGTAPDPAITGVMPTAALLYRRGDVREAIHQYALKMPADKYFGSSEQTFRVGRTLSEASKYSAAFEKTPILPWFTPTEPEAGQTIITDPNENRIAANATSIISDTGELERNWRKGVQRIDSDRAQAVHGWIGGETYDLKDVSVKVASPQKAVVSAIALDGRPLHSSYNIFVTALAQATWSSDQRAWLSEPVSATVQITAPPGLKAVALDGKGQVKKELSAPYSAGSYTLTISPTVGTHWFALQGTPPPIPNAPTNLRLVK